MPRKEIEYIKILINFEESLMVTLNNINLKANQTKVMESDLKANGGDNLDTLSTVINGSHLFIKRLAVKSRGIIVYDTDNLHLVTFVKNLLEYSDDYSRSVA